MNRKIIGFVLALTTLPLGACVTDGYGYGGGFAVSSYPYTGWYDGYYGSIYDGYWGSDGYYYYRGNAQERIYHRSDHDHFRNGAQAPDGHFNRIQGQTQRPDAGVRAPHFPRGQARNPQARDRH